MSPTDPLLQQPDSAAGPAAPANGPGQIPLQQASIPRLPVVVPVWPANSHLDLVLKLSTEEDPLAVDLNDQTLPGVTWEGIEHSADKFSKVWETDFVVPEVRPPPLSAAPRILDELTSPRAHSRSSTTVVYTSMPS